MAIGRATGHVFSDEVDVRKTIVIVVYRYDDIGAFLERHQKSYVSTIVAIFRDAASQFRETS